MYSYPLTKAAACAFLLSVFATFGTSASFAAEAANTEHPMNTDHSRANTSASDPQDPKANASSHDSFAPSSGTSASGIGTTDNTMSSSTGSEGVIHPSAH